MGGAVLGETEGPGLIEGMAGVGDLLGDAGADLVGAFFLQDGGAGEGADAAGEGGEVSAIEVYALELDEDGEEMLLDKAEKGFVDIDVVVGSGLDDGAGLCGGEADGLEAEFEFVGMALHGEGADEAAVLAQPELQFAIASEVATGYSVVEFGTDLGRQLLNAEGPMARLGFGDGDGVGWINHALTNTCAAARCRQEIRGCIRRRQRPGR